MKLNLFDLSKLNKYPLIKDVIIYPLKVNRDKRGYLIETLKSSWQSVYNKQYPFSQTYFSVTESNTARDEDQWHIHPTKQIDRFVVSLGEIVVVLYDWRKKSATFGYINYFHMGEFQNQDIGYYLLLVPKNVLHCFLVVSRYKAMIINYPNFLYDKNEEGRIKFTQVTINKNMYFNWNDIRKKFNLPLK